MARILHTFRYFANWKKKGFDLNIYLLSVLTRDRCWKCLVWWFFPFMTKATRPKYINNHSGRQHHQHKDNLTATQKNLKPWIQKSTIWLKVGWKQTLSCRVSHHTSKATHSPFNLMSFMLISMRAPVPKWWKKLYIKTEHYLALHQMWTNVCGPTSRWQTHQSSV